MVSGRKVLPWTDTNPQMEQERFILATLEGREKFSSLCRAFGISRKTGYTRLYRYEEEGFEGLGDQSRAPHSHPNRVPEAVEEQVVAARQAHPTWGPKKLGAWLRERYPQAEWPAASTVGNILERHGLTQPRRKVRRTPGWSEPFAQCQGSNQVWCVDFKGQFRTGEGEVVYPLTLEDAHSRYLLCCQGLGSAHGAGVRRSLEGVFREYGLPAVIRSDNGPPFASVGLGGLSKLAVWWVKLGIVPERIQPGHPEQNGRLERLHRTLKGEVASPPRRNRREQQVAFDQFRWRYNQERPHEALGQQAPARHYQPSSREYPARVSSPEYPSEAQVRRVRSNGEIKWQGDRIYLSETLVGEPVALVAQDDRYLSIRFGPLEIGQLDTCTKRVLRTPTKVLPMSLVYL